MNGAALQVIQVVGSPSDTASKLHDMGFSVIPSGAGEKGKAPFVAWAEYQQKRPTEAELLNWQRELKPPLWGMVTGTISGVVVVDADTTEARAELEAEIGQPHVLTPRGGGHWYFRHPGQLVKTAVGVLPKVDVRADGGFVNVVGKRPDGEYRIITLPAPDNLIPWDRLPERIRLALDGSKPIPQAAKGEGTPVPEGQRNQHLSSLAGTMRRRGMPQSAIEVALLAVNSTQCQPPLPEKEVVAIAQSVTRYEPHADFATTDLGNAQRLAYYSAALVRYCYERKLWLVWNGKSWEWDRGDKITALAKNAVRQIYGEAADGKDEKKRKDLAEHARRSESEQRIRSMISLAQSEPGIPIKVTELDSNPWLFNCRNGTLDLRTGELLSHQKENLLTVVVPIDYDPNATCPLWLKFLVAVTGGDSKLQAYLQRAVGYSLTGITKVQSLFFLYGLGNNGKSTFVAIIRKLTGDYGERVNTDLFMVKDRSGSGPKEGLANLRGKRFVVASELEDGKRLAVSLIKDMTGGETIKADRKYEHEVEYQPTHKLWLVGNHKPVITDTTFSIWRRVKLIPFTITIPRDEIDQDLPEKLEAELPGILAWAVKGCQEWQQNGLGEPDAVANATANYRHDQDIIGDFIEDCCVLDSHASITKTDMKNAYSAWCQVNSNEQENQRNFKSRLVERGISEGRAGKGRFWKGIRIKSDDNSDKS